MLECPDIVSIHLYGFHIGVSPLWWSPMLGNWAMGRAGVPNWRPSSSLIWLHHVNIHKKGSDTPTFVLNPQAIV